MNTFCCIRRSTDRLFYTRTLLKDWTSTEPTQRTSRSGKQGQFNQQWDRLGALCWLIRERVALTDFRVNHRIYGYPSHPLQQSCESRRSGRPQQPQIGHSVNDAGGRESHSRIAAWRCTITSGDSARVNACTRCIRSRSLAVIRSRYVVPPSLRHYTRRLQFRSLPASGIGLRM